MRPVLRVRTILPGTFSSESFAIVRAVDPITRPGVEAESPREL
jgi:hypothetical protein